MGEFTAGRSNSRSVCKILGYRMQLLKEKMRTVPREYFGDVPDYYIEYVGYVVARCLPGLQIVRSSSGSVIEIAY